jgi:hypothetical protein
MQVSTHLRYSGATPVTVFAMLLDKDFQDRKCAATGALDHRVEITEYDDGSATIMTVRTMPTDSLPELARSFVGATLSVRQTDEWQAPAPDGARDGTLLVEIEGAPVRMTGTLRLAGEGAGAVESVDGDVKVRVPLVGGQLEKLVAPVILAATQVEERTGAAWLAP